MIRAEMSASLRRLLRPAPGDIDLRVDGAIDVPGMIEQGVGPGEIRGAAGSRRVVHGKERPTMVIIGTLASGDGPCV